MIYNLGDCYFESLGKKSEPRMSFVINLLIFVFFANAIVAFFIAFFWHGKVIAKIHNDADWENAMLPWRALADKNSPQNRFGYFLAGEIFPELRRKWFRAVAYVVCSFVALFVSVGLVTLFAPDMMW